MEEWDKIDGEIAVGGLFEEAGSSVSGHEYYTIVVGHTDFRAKCFMPSGVLKDDAGKDQVGRYKAANGMARPLEGYFTGAGTGGFNSVDKRLVLAFKTPRDVLDRLPEMTKRLVNAVKKMLNESKVAVWYHNENIDKCSMFGGPHIHIIYQAIDKGSNRFVRWHDTIQCRNLKKVIEQSGGYHRSEAVKSVDNLMRHFNKKPRVFMGTNHGVFGRTRLENLDQEPTMAYEDILELEGDDLVPIEEPVAVVFKSDWDEPSPKRCNDDFGEVVPIKKAKMDDFFGIKETPHDRRLRPLNAIVDVVGKCDFESINTYVATKLKSDDPIRVAWNTLAGRSSTHTDLALLFNKRKVDEIGMTLNQLSERYLKRVGSSEHDNYLDLKTSLSNYLNWLDYQGIDVDRFVADVVDIYDKKRMKINALVMHGEPHSGKSLFLMRTLEPLSNYSAMVNAEGNSSEFCYMNMIGCRVSFWEEVKVSDTMVQTAKQLFEGSKEVTLKVKGKAPAVCGRVPIFGSCNSNPFMLCPHIDQKAMKARCIEYNVKSDPNLEELPLYIHPGVWYVFSRLNEQNIEITRESVETVSVPEMTQPNNLNLLD